MNKAQKKQAATLFADSASLEQLRQLGKSRSEEEQREFSRLYQKSRRIEQRAQLRGEKSPHDKFADTSEFWEANRLLLPKKKLDEYLAQQEQVLDIEFWMENGFNCDPSDPDFVSLEEGLATITEHIVMFEAIHDHPTAYHTPILRNHAPYFAAWCPRDVSDSIHGRVPAFFKQKEVFDALCNEESRPTEVMARYGIKTALSSWEVLLFQKRIANHATGAGEHGLMIGPRKWEVPGCWLCGFEAAQRKRNLATPEGPTPQGVVVPPTATA